MDPSAGADSSAGWKVFRVGRVLNSRTTPCGPATAGVEPTPHCGPTFLCLRAHLAVPYLLDYHHWDDVSQSRCSVTWGSSRTAIRAPLSPSRLGWLACTRRWAQPVIYGSQHYCNTRHCRRWAGRPGSADTAGETWEPIDNLRHPCGWHVAHDWTWEPIDTLRQWSVTKQETSQQLPQTFQQQLFRPVRSSPRLQRACIHPAGRLLWTLRCSATWAWSSTGADWQDAALPVAWWRLAALHCHSPLARAAPSFAWWPTKGLWRCQCTERQRRWDTFLDAASYRSSWMLLLPASAAGVALAIGPGPQAPPTWIRLPQSEAWV